MTTWQHYLQEQQPRFIDELLALLSIPSISTLPEHTEDVQRAATWVAERMSAAGIENVEVMPTGGHPVVYGDWLHAEGQPTVLIYGHFDVQPVDPLELWDSPPFEPVIKDGCVYARGASDVKGSTLLTILACEALLQTEGALPVNVKFMIEGQEEVGSPQLPDFVAKHKKLLACDMVISADSGQWSMDEPCLVVGLKGICAIEIDVTGPHTDLHSGMHGGAVQNPLHALVRLLDSMRSPEGEVLVEGFYDAVEPISAEDQANMAALPFDEEIYLADLGLDIAFGEPGYTTLERLWVRPTLEINGMHGGFIGAGTKTIIPTHAHAKITCRLVPNQDPDKIAAFIARHVSQHKPPGVKIKMTHLESSAAYHMPSDHPGNAAAAQALETLYGRKPYILREGGSVPICGILLAELGVYTVSFGFGLNDENIHAPNEFYRLKNFERGQAGYCYLLHNLKSGG